MTGAGMRSGQRPPMRTAARLAALLVTLAGLFAMHGLADHGTSGHGAMAGMSGAAVVAPAQVADFHGAHASEPTESGPSDGSLAGSQGQDHDMSLVGLCLATVAALLLVTAAAMSAGFWQSVRALIASQQHTVAWVRARDPAPPDLVRLCVQRC